MMFVVKNLDNAKPKHMAVISEIMGEVLLCLKDANSKTRDSAYHLLIEMANVQDDFSVFIKIILAALGAQTPHMRSAAVMALSRIVFEFAKVNETVHSYLPSLLQTVLVLFNDNAREVVKAVIGFVRVVIANLSRDQLEPLLPEIVEGLMKYNKGKGRFRSKIKIILKKLVQYFGYEVITPLVPGDDSRLITHIRKLSERAARKKSSAVQDSRKENVDYRFDDMMSSDEYDSDNGRTLMTGATGLNRKAKTGTVVGSNMSRSIAPSMKSFRTKATVAGPFIGVGNEKDGEVIDLLDSRSHMKVGYPDHDENSDFSDGDDDDLMMFDDGGKLVIREYGDKVEENTVTKDTEDDESRVIMAGQSIKKQRVSKYQSAKIDRDDRKQIALSTKRSAKDLGLAYKSNKAGGDVKRKDQKYEPYAYVPLDGKRYTKKNRDLAIAEMATVVRSKKRKNR
jgi:ribosomal RNA-processing protein 12